MYCILCNTDVHTGEHRHQCDILFIKIKLLKLSFQYYLFELDELSELIKDRFK